VQVEVAADPISTSPVRLVLPEAKVPFVPVPQAPDAIIGVPVPSVAKFCTVESPIPADTVLLIMSSTSDPVGAVMTWIPGVGCWAFAQCWASREYPTHKRNAKPQMIALRLFCILIRRDAALLVRGSVSGLQAPRCPPDHHDRGFL